MKQLFLWAYLLFVGQLAMAQAPQRVFEWSRDMQPQVNEIFKPLYEPADTVSSSKNRSLFMTNTPSIILRGMSTPSNSSL
ncbi:MAG: hypothetical protein HUK09_03435 [Bacteroidaceae bacterium]|nr:hypothetical protein [Bacteroidaceae bacterium]